MIIFMLSFPDPGDKFNQIYLYYGRLMLYKANEILKDSALSEDAVSEAFIRIYKNLHKLDNTVPSNRTASFVVTVTKNVALTMIKKQKRFETIELDESIQNERQLEESILSDLSSQSILEIVDGLSDELKNVFLLYYAHEMNHKEIASALGITANTAAVRLHRARKKLGDILMAGEGGKDHGQ